MKRLLGRKIIICDGAMGTMLQSKGIDAGPIPELLNFTHVESLQELFEAYYESGSDLVCTNTFGANRLKLKGTGYSVEQVITQAVNIAREVADRYNKGIKPEKFVALDLSTIGKLMEPAGELTFEDAYDIFKEQVIAGAEAGADLIIFETFTDIYELKAAILAAKENCNLPVFCTVTFQDNGRTLMGSDPITAINVLQDLNIDAIGANCSLGPKDMVPIIKEMLKYAKIPVMVQPNAGLPKLVNGQVQYDVKIEEFTEAMLEMIEAGASVVGGCCGTNPQYIKALSKEINRKKLIGDIKENKYESELLIDDEEEGAIRFTAVSSCTKTVFLGDKVSIIGERINPTGKKLLKEALLNQDLSYVENEALAQLQGGADILDVNVGIPGIDEKQMMLSVLKRLSDLTDVPLQIDSADPDVIEAASRVYRGKPLINSVNGKQEVMDRIFPIVKKYGACVVALTLDEKGLPETTEERIAIAEKIIEEAAKYDITRDRILVDCLTLTVSAQQNAGNDTLEAIRQVKALFGVKTTLGASNVSFGLPERKLLNRTFLAMALEAGLDAPITDPTVPEYVDTIRAFEVLSNRDVESARYIQIYGEKNQNTKMAQVQRVKVDSSDSDKNKEENNLETQMEAIILEGFQDRAAEVTTALLAKYEPLDIVESIIIPSLEKVGKNYEVGDIYLPQLIKSADTVRCAFEIIKPVLEKSGQTMAYGKVILATVQGDIHDIGKNIVKILLQNYGYEVIDLGKDVPIETVVQAAKEEGIKMVGLSALMTTTVVNMEKTIKALRENGLDCVVAVGGAVLTEAYAKDIGADHYCKDAMDTVRVANLVFK